MANEGMMQVEVLYATPDTVWRRQVDLPSGATAAQAIEASGLMAEHPEFAGVVPPLGVYGRVCPPQQALKPGDRLEIYRPLVFDPMESRRRRMRHRERTKGKLSET